MIKTGHILEIKEVYICNWRLYEIALRRSRKTKMKYAVFFDFTM